METKTRRAEYSELAAVFFLQAMAAGIWLVPLGRVLSAHGLAELRPFAFATSALAALISPLVFAAMADRHFSPVRVLRWLTAASGVTMAVASWSIARGCGAAFVLALIQVYALCAAPTGSIANAIVFARLRDSQREFGPVRAVATVGWMCGCWLVSGLGADASTVAGYAGAAVWLVLAATTFLLPDVPPPASAGKPTWSQRLGWDALSLLKTRDHRVVFITAAAFSIPLAAFYPFTPAQLDQLGFHRTSAWMSLGQVTEVICMLALASLFTRCRLKWIFAAGLLIGLLRFALCAVNRPAWVLLGVFLHGFSFTLFFITAQIYVNERVDPAWRARAQGLMWLMTGGAGNLAGYLGTGLWFRTCSARFGASLWLAFWLGLCVAIAGVLAWFLAAYQGLGPGVRAQPHTRAG